MQGEIKKAQEFASARFSYRAGQFGVVARATLRGARRYSVFVRIMKGALPLTALGLAALVLIYVLQPPPARMQMSFQRLSSLTNDLSMDNPRLSGTDNDGQPFVISASRATPEDRSSDRVRMQDVIADFSMKDGTGIHMTAASGLIDTRTHILQMTGGIHMTAQNGYDAKAPSAEADLRAGTVHGEGGVDANGAFGRITAQKFAVNQTSKQLHFWGDVKMILNPDNRGGGKPGNSR
jgi:lipopolysaccharide export system protein LptC